MAKQPTIKLEKLLPTKTATYDPAKQVAGLKKRLGASALPSAKVDDGRNPIERALNLRPDQNVFFDVVEVLDRPRSAIAGAAVAAQKGQDIGKAVTAGLTGEKFTSWKEYLVNTGLEDREGKIDFADVAGIVMDMFVDPMNIPLWGVSKLAGKAKVVATEAISLGKDMGLAIKGLDSTASITKIAGFNANSIKLLDLSEQMGSLVKNTMGQEMALALRNAADATTVEAFNAAMSAFATVATSKKTVSTMNALGRGLSITASGTIKAADKSITKLLTSLDGLNIRTGGDLADDISKFAKEVTALDRYTNFKTFVSSVFDKSKVLGERLSNRVKMTLGKAGYFGEEAKVYITMYDDVIKSYAKATGKTVEESSRTLMKVFEFSNYTGDFVVGEMLSNKELMTKVGMNASEVNNVKSALASLRDFKTGKAIYTKETIDRMFVNSRLGNGVNAFFFRPDQIDDVTKNYKSFRDAIEALARDIPESKSLSNLVEATDVFDKVIPKAKFYNSKEVLEFTKLQSDAVTKAHLTELDTITNNMYSTVNDRLGFGREYYQPGKVITPHQPTKESQELFRQFEEFRFLDKKLKGNIKVGAERIYQMSAYEANLMYKANAKNILKYGENITGRYKTFLQKSANGQLFTEYINTSFADWLTEAPRTITQSKILADIMVTGTFADENLISATPMIQSASGAIVPSTSLGKVNFSKQAFLDKIEEMARYQTNKAPFEEAKKIIKAIKGDSLAIDANIFDLIGINTKGAVGTEAFFKIVDEANNIFKKFKLLSPGFHMRNFVGNLFNMIVGGVDPTKTLQYQGDVFKIMTNGSDLIEKTVRAGVNLATDDATLLKVLSADELRLFKVLKDYSFANLPKAGRMLWDLPEDVTKLLNDNAGDTKKLKLYQKALKYNAQANEIVDTYFRLQTFMFARENPEILMRYGLVNPQDLVRRIHFDPSDLSAIEKSTLKRLIPFYTFTKKNLAFQIRNFADNPRLYKQVATLFDGVWKANDIDPYSELEDFKREQFWLPIFKQEDGKYYALKLNLPIGDLNEFLNNPLQRAASSFTPIMRAPFELAANTQIFSGLPIQEFKGQKAYNLDFLNMVNKIPGLEMFDARTAEYLISQTGLDVPAALVGGTLKGVSDLVSGEAGAGELLSRGALQSAVSVGSKEKGIRNRQYQELRRLQGLLRYAKQEGIEVPTVSEVENKRSPLNNLIKKIRIKGLAG
jgi:hypothetical protein